MAKRVFDITVSLIALVLLGPLLILLAVLVRLDSPGAAIFRQRRAGWRGRPFVMLKFRTMRTDAAPYGVSPHSGDDPRLTKIGKFLRETSLDELPQLWNVLVGSMSIVGPRPLYERQAELWNEHQRRRLDVKPGLTGYAQVFGRGAITHEEKIEMDVHYVENKSLKMDIGIIFRTFFSIFGSKIDIYEQQYSIVKRHETDCETSESEKTVLRAGRLEESRKNS
ncbi:MAG: sugar transferase [Phycisphaerae bacterium]|nr:sugar transferase [Phycisphaerae bacterium]